MADEMHANAQPTTHVRWIRSGPMAAANRPVTISVACIWMATIVVASLTPLAVGADRVDDASPDSPQRTRSPWATSRLHGSPEPPLPYTTENAFPSLPKFRNCLDLAAMPGSDLLFVLEQKGRIYSFHNQANAQRADLVIDLAEHLDGVDQSFGIVFDPDFQRNRFLYVCWVEAPDRPNGTYVSRFEVSDSEQPTISPESEHTIIRWRSGGHNGGCLKFGPDGYLYISAGDAGPASPPDPLRAGQDLSNVLSSVMRIDIRGDDFPEDERRNYRIPQDNPFVNIDSARGEIWAFGLRNPWRMSFDAQTGDLWVGDVGWELWEMMTRIDRGGNYGWSIVEGRQPVHADVPPGPAPILPPTIDHAHSESSSITDGLTYYGDRLPQLHGMHIYGDFDTGKFWGFRFKDQKVVDHVELADTTLRVVGFGDDQRGDFYILGYASGEIHRMIENPLQGQAGDFPRRLSETGLFNSLDDQSPQPGVLPYEVNAHRWADYASSQRWIGLPGAAKVDVRDGRWKFPDGTVFAKTLSLEMTAGDPLTRRNVETQILHFDGVDWNPYSYVWNEEQTDADLVAAGGTEQEFAIDDASAPGGVRRQMWRVAGRAECQRCHNPWSGPPLAFNTQQLNRAVDVDGIHVNQLDQLFATSVISKRIHEAERVLLVPPLDVDHALDLRGRAYLDVNCAHCHRANAGSSVLAMMPYDLPLDKTEMLNVRPMQGDFGIRDAAIIAAGDPFRSVLWYRVAKLGTGHMPHIGSSEVDQAGLRLLYEWIRQIPSPEAPLSGVSISHDLTEHHDTLETLAALREEVSPEQQQVIAKLLASPYKALHLMHAIDCNTVSPAIVSLVNDQSRQLENASVRDLFERFVPADQRLKRLRGTIDPDDILKLTGDVSQGRELFLNTAGLQCKNCHQVELSSGDPVLETHDLGPNLAKIGAKYKRAELLESILEPSRKVDPAYIVYVAVTNEGASRSGLLVQKTESKVVLRDAQGVTHQFDRDEIEQLTPQSQSFMPDMLLRELTAQQAANLLAFLESLR